MTVAAAAAKAGPYTGNGVTSSFAFAFKVFADADIRVVETLISTGVETDLVLNTNYTVTRNVDQDANPGGTITYKVSGVTTALPATKKLTIVGDFDYEQPTDIPNGGPFLASAIETAFDRVTMLVKQVKERVDRAVVVDVSSTTDPDDLLDEITTAVASAQAISALYDAFDDRYLGAKASDPTLDNDGDTLAVGALYFNTSTGVMRVHNSALAWQDAAGASTISGTTQTFDGDGADTTFTLSAAPPALQLLEVFLSGVRQTPTTDYTLSGTTLTFTTAPPVGTGNIFCYWVSQVAAGVPGDGTVTTVKLADANVTAAKVAPDFVSGQTAETAPAVDDVALLGDTSAGAPRKMTLANLLKVVNSLTEDTTPDSAADYVLTYDASASGVKKAKPRSLRTLAPMTAQAASGTSIDFTSIPAGVNRITIAFAEVSTNGTSAIQVQLGDSGGVETAGYATSTWTANTSNTNYTSGFVFRVGSVAAMTVSGSLVLTRVDSNTWIGSGVAGRTDAADTSVFGGSKALSDTLDRIRITTVSGDTFDAGTFNVLYE